MKLEAWNLKLELMGIYAPVAEYKRHLANAPVGVDQSDLAFIRERIETLSANHPLATRRAQQPKAGQEEARVTA